MKKAKKAGSKKSSTSASKITEANTTEASSSPPTQPPDENLGRGANEESDPTPVAEFDPYDAEAWAWMSSPDSIPGAYSPILYIGTHVSVEVSKLLGRPMTLEEAQHLVQPDGEMTTCASEGTEFQPVRYLPFVPVNMVNQLAHGKKLTEIILPYGGAYYVNKDQQPVGFSGSVFHYNTRRQDYEYCHTSPLVITAQEMKKARGRMQWGVPFGIANSMTKAREENNERRTKIAGLVSSLFSPIRKGFATIGDTFPRGTRKDWKNNGKKRRERVTEE